MWNEVVVDLMKAERPLQQGEDGEDYEPLSELIDSVNWRIASIRRAHLSDRAERDLDVEEAYSIVTRNYLNALLDMSIKEETGEGEWIEKSY